MKKLYFIAIYPPQQIIDEVKMFKQDLAQNYQNSKALKNEAHMSPFEIELNGFGSFPKPENPVLFVKPEKNDHLTELFHRIKKQFVFGKNTFNPHVTIGYRNLTFENYLKAWKIYKDKYYKTTFLVDKISLLRHDGKWISINEKKLSLKKNRLLK